MRLLDVDEGQEAEVEEDVEPHHLGHGEDQANVGICLVASLSRLFAKTAPHTSGLGVILHDDLVDGLHQALVLDLDVNVDLSIGEGLEDVLESGKCSFLWHHRTITVVFSWTEVNIEFLFDSWQLIEGQVSDVFVNTSESEQMLVMGHHDLAIPGQMDVKFQHPSSQCHGVVIGLQGVLVTLPCASCNILTNQSLELQIKIQGGEDPVI